MERIGGAATAVQSPGLTAQTKRNAEPDQKAFKDVWNEIMATHGEKPKEVRRPKKTLDKDDFLRIMVTQMKNQDPTKPFEADKLAAEIAQITSVEQLQNVNNALKQLSNQNKPLERLATTSLIGKTVSLDNNRFMHEAGKNKNVEFNLPQDANTVVKIISDETGEVVATKDMGGLSSGINSFVWDGRKDDNVPAKSGNYTLDIEAKNERGFDVPVSAKSQKKIIGVSLRGGEPVFLVGDRNQQRRITMNEIVEITDGSETAFIKNDSGASNGNGQLFSVDLPGSKK